MNDIVLILVRAVFIGLGATLTFDLWGQFLKRAFGIVPSNTCLVGRWLSYMPDGIFRHSTIQSVPQKPAECVIGWVAHYTIGVTLALAFVAVIGLQWLVQPTVIPAVVFGVVTVVAPFVIMQPAMGLGFAASKAPNPPQARVRSVMNHVAFGLGLYLFGLLTTWLPPY